MIIDEYTKILNENIELYGEKTILFFKVGSFYEIYGKNRDDFSLKVADEVLSLRIAKKSNSKSKDDLFMAGFPDSSYERFEKKLIKNGFTVIFVDQRTDDDGKIERFTSRRSSPGTYFSDDSSKIASILIFQKEVHRLMFDTITGQVEFLEVKEFVKDTNLFDIDSSEYLLITENDINYTLENDETLTHKIKFNPDYMLDSYQEQRIEHFYPQFKNNMQSVLERFGLSDKIAICNLIYILEFVESHDKNIVRNLKCPIAFKKKSNKMKKYNQVDAIINLTGDHSVCRLIDNAVTIDGSKRIMDRLQSPYNNIEDIMQQQNEITKYVNDLPKVNCIKGILKKIPKNLSLFFRKIEILRADPNVIVNLGNLIKNLGELCHATNNEKIHKNLETNFNYIFKENSTNDLNPFRNNDDLQEIVDKMRIIEKKIDVFCEKHDFKKIIKNDRISIETTLKKGKEFIEKKSSCDYRIQKLSSKAIIYSTKINENIEQFSEYFCEYGKLFKISLEKALEQINDSKTFSDIVTFVSKIDLDTSMSLNVHKFNLCKPEKCEHKIEIEHLRHPLLENTLHKTNEKLITNDLKNDDQVILMGLNSSGKSVFLKSLAINHILFQAGFYCFAKKFSSKVYSKIFYRAGNCDFIDKKQSSFVHEILELNEIIENCDGASLVFLDELASSTEPVSATKIFIETIKFLIDRKASFFSATHYNVSSEFDRDLFYYIESVIENDDTIKFTRKIKKGIFEEKNYGVKVAMNLIKNKKFKKMLARNKFSPNIIKKSRYNSHKIAFECEICGVVPGPEDIPLDFHHVQEQCDATRGYNEDSTKLNARSNLQAVCKKCHQKIHSNH